MVDFGASIAAGIEAHQEHINNISEITEILSALREQMLAATQGKVATKMEAVDVDIDEMLALNFRSEGTAILAFSVKHPEITRRLTLIRVPASGYPVWLKWSKERITCSDKDSLVSALSALLSSSFVGRAVTELADYSPGD